MQPIPPPDAKTETIDKHPYGFAVRVFCVSVRPLGRGKLELSLHEIHFARVRRAKKCRFFAGAARRFCANPKKHARGPRRCLVPGGQTCYSVFIEKHMCICCVHGEGIEVKNLERRFLLVDVSVLPEVFLKVLKAKELLAAGSAKNVSAATKMPDFPAVPFTSIRTVFLTRKTARKC